RMVDRSSAQAIYKGLAMAKTGGINYLYATNFHAGQIEVFDSKYRPVTTLAGNFHDETIPDNFAPFGIENIGNLLYVSYAVQDQDKEDDVAGAGNGLIDVFRPDGTLVRRLVSNGKLNSPWGMAKAPTDFGKFSNDLLIGNFGNGRINAYNPRTGAF